MPDNPITPDSPITQGDQDHALLASIFQPSALAALSVPGPVGPLGPQGLPGPTGLPGPIGPSGAGVLAVVSSAPPAGLPIPVGDGVHDDTAAVQAGLDHAAARNIDYLFAPGTYRVGPLHIATPGVATATGIIIRGQSGGRGWDPGNGAGQGVILVARDDHQEAIFLVGAAQTHNWQIHSLSLRGNATTQAGIKARATNWSQGSIYDLSFEDCGVSVYISNPDGGGNGEFWTAYGCTFGGFVNAVSCYKNDSTGGQAVDHRFYGCVFGGTNGATLLDVGTGWPNGCTVTCFGFCGTMVAGPLPNTLCHLRGSAGVTIVGGTRLENMTRLGVLDRSFGRLSVQGIITDGNPLDAGGLTFLDADGAGNYCSVVVRDCTFVGNGHPLSLNVGAGNPNFTASFDSCDWHDYSGYTALTAPPAGTVKTKFRNCRSAVSGTGGAYLDIPDR